MATESTAITPAAESAAKAKTVADDMAARRIFDSVEEVQAYMAQAADTFTDFGEVPVAAPGVNEDGEFDPEIYNESMQIMVSVLKRQGKGAKAIVVAPVPKVDVLLDSDAGREWVRKILLKELNHVAVRHLRDAEDVLNFVDQMPTTVDGYITSERGTGGIIETFNALYKGIDAALSQKLPVWAKTRFTKGELKKALESKGYALEFYSTVEDYKGQSLLEAALEIGIQAAKRKGLDPTIFERWKATRATKTYTPGEDDEDEELNLDALSALVGEDEAKADSAPAGDAANGDQPETTDDSATDSTADADQPTA